ncbi:MAG: NAD-dependent succinate-semialdehyde dehydrogenase [FCB group bacterium]|nr:NAD-dependent succinate-semialdehyde dehydrogenase [FCB group bacterium]
MSLKSINPANGEIIRTYEEMSANEVADTIDRTQEAYLAWRKSDYSERSAIMLKAAQLLRERKDEYGRLMSLEMGKPLAQALAEAEKCAWVCEYYAENAASFLAPKIIPTDASKSYVTFQPIGIVLAVMPWNFPFWQVLRFAVPALMAGNGAVLKHASNVQGCALAIEQLFRDAGLPENLFRTLVIGSRQVGQVIENPNIKAVTLTGSTPAGQAVAAKAGSLLKKTVLELGGSDPYVVLEDADLEQAVKACVAGRLLNTGQSCIAAKRFIVVESVKDEFERLLLENMSSKTMGDPLAGSFDLGPMVNIAARDELHEQVQKTIKMGAHLLLGGVIPDLPGSFYPPTLLTGVVPGMPAFDEELFGPVAVIITAADEEEAIDLANRTNFGLGAAVFTRDTEKGERIAATQLQAGSCFVNDFVRSDPRLPFGGIKESGYGRELSDFGIYEFVNIKTVYIR